MFVATGSESGLSAPVARFEDKSWVKRYPECLTPFYSLCLVGRKIVCLCQCFNHCPIQPYKLSRVLIGIWKVFWISSETCIICTFHRIGALLIQRCQRAWTYLSVEKLVGGECLVLRSPHQTSRWVGGVVDVVDTVTFHFTSMCLCLSGNISTMLLSFSRG